MFDLLLIDGPLPRPEATDARQELQGLYPWVAVLAGRPPHPAGAPPGAVTVSTPAWEAPDFDPLTLDHQVAVALAERGALALRVAEPTDPARARRVARQVLTRYHRFIEGRNLASQDPVFDRALGLHRALHDRRKPLVAADFDHARDTWRWVLRLDPLAGLPVQLAALFHDIERLQSESDVRVEQHSLDYPRFKAAHAAGGAEQVGQLLRLIEAPLALVEAVADLVRGHERPGAGRDCQLLNEADALSFFSLNACGFAAYYGPAHTRRKVAFTLDRLSPRGWRELGGIRHRADFQIMIDQHRRAAGRMTA